MLNFQSPIPLYHQLAEIITAKIRSGKYPPGKAIPSEIELKNRYKIGRPTVRQALDLLVKKDLVIRKRGSGTFVKKNTVKIDLFSLAGTSLAFGAKDISIETTILTAISSIDVKEDNENPFFNSRAFFLSRLTKAETKPVLIEDIFFHPLLFAGIDKIDLAGKSLAQVISDNYYLKPENGRQTFKIVTLSQKNAELLHLEKDDAVLEVKRTLNFPGAKKAVYSRLLCKTDEYAFSQTISGNGK
ncbi:MAG: GntR family transcriptional regulator [Desulfobacterales bacterium]|nr:GntR family transcriptional regulator [Desulfobacterales bacterium]